MGTASARRQGLGFIHQESLGTTLRGLGFTMDLVGALGCPSSGSDSQKVYKRQRTQLKAD